ncbi:MAG: VTT domain-containing protein [bacterium]|nr:VTT domain-containing protein [bacterium]
MNFEEIINSQGIYVASFVVGIVSGFVPFINTEVFLVLVSATATRPALFPVAILSAVGQMIAKSVIFYAGRGVIKIKMGKYESKVAAVHEKFARWENKADLLILLSAAVGFPPFYVVSFVAGALKNHFAKFLVAGLVGRSIRFAAVVYFPQLVMRYI